MRNIDGLAGKGDWRKQMLPCNDGDTGCGYELWVLTILYNHTLPDSKESPLPIGLSLQDNLRNLYYEEKQMTVSRSASSDIGAASAAQLWDSINWPLVERAVYRLQMRIAKARRQKHFGRLKSLQWLLTHSLDAKLLAVKRVTTSSGAKTAGVDGKTYRSNGMKMLLVMSLRQRGYKAKPLRRVYIPKSNGKKRPLGIPTLYDRAMQALYLLALEPVAEMQADPNSYGFRPRRSTADAIEQAFRVLCNQDGAKWVLEGDIKGCFDNISHDWLLANVLVDKRILQQWLKAGYIENQTLFQTSEGTAQGGSISPLLANLALDGLESAITTQISKAKRRSGRWKGTRRKTARHKVHFIRYPKKRSCQTLPSILNYPQETM